MGCFNKFFIEGKEVRFFEVRMDIETGRGGFSVTTVQAVVGDVIEVWYEFGPDNVTSSGFAVSITCQEVPPSTTTTSSSLPTSTTSVPSSTTTTEPSTTTTSTTAPESSSTTTTVATPPPTDQPSPPPTASPPSTVPVIPSGVPTGEGMPETHSLMGAFWLLAAGVSTLIGAGTWAYSRGGDDD